MLWLSEAQALFLVQPVFWRDLGLGQLCALQIRGKLVKFLEALVAPLLDLLADPLTVERVLQTGDVLVLAEVLLFV